MPLLLKRLALAQGPPPGFSIPAGATGPPPGISIPADATGPPPGLFTSATATAASAASSALTTGPPTSIDSAPQRLRGPPVRMSQQSLHTMIGVTTMLIVLCTCALTGRLISRRMVKQRFGVDDYLAIGAWVCFLALATEQFILAHYGGMDAPFAETMRALGQMKFGSTLTYTFVTTAAKLSLLFLYKRVFMLRVTWFRWAWWASVALVGLYGLALFLNNLLCCYPKPPSAMWGGDLGACKFNKTEPVVMGFLNAGVDFAVLLLPVRMVWGLQMRRRQKWAISGVFGLGLIGTAVSIARAAALASPDLFTKGMIRFAIWSTVEPAVALICACLPVMRPLFTYIQKLLPTSFTSSARWPSFSRFSSSKSGKKISSPLASGESKTLTANSSSSAAPSSGDTAGKYSRDDSFEKYGYSKVETKIEAREMPSSSSSSSSSGCKGGIPRTLSPAPTKSSNPTPPNPSYWSQIPKPACPSLSSPIHPNKSKSRSNISLFPKHWGWKGQSAKVAPTGLRRPSQTCDSGGRQRPRIEVVREIRSQTMVGSVGRLGSGETVVDNH